jgi:hypothetical protein
MGEQASAQDKERTDRGDSDSQEQAPSEKPEPDEKAKEAAAEMMTAYKDRPTLVLPGTGGAVAGTAVNDWLDEDGNPKSVQDADALAARAKAAADEEQDEEQVAKDKAFNEAVRKAAKAKTADDENDDEKAVSK